MHPSHLTFVVAVLTAQSVFSLTIDEIAIACTLEHKYDGKLADINYNDPAIPKAAKCALACSFEYRDVIKADGSIDRAKVKELSKEIIETEEKLEKYLKAADDCDVSAKSDKCETAFEFVKCCKNKI